MKRIFISLSAVALLMLSCRVVNPVMIKLENDKPSISTGESYNGDLTNGKRLPNKGKNFTAASYLFTALGRNGVTDKLRDLVLETYDSLYSRYPDQYYQYGETGWVGGGKFWPHYTHRNGLVIDFLVPVLDKEDQTRKKMKTHIFNRWGYAYHFDSTGCSKNYCIDFESMARHLDMLQQLAPKHHLKIKRIIFTTEFYPKLYNTEKGSAMRNIQFVQKSLWLRHDDHYHTEFEIIP